MPHKESDMNDKFINKIPDIYFDWYARLIPGSIAVASYFFFGNKAFSTNATDLFVYAFAAYVCGHIIQPLSSLIVVNLFERVSGSNESTYAAAKKNKDLASPVGKVSKAHAESVGMLSSCLLVIAVAWYVFGLSNEWPRLLNFLIAYFFIASFERAWARRRKIDALA